MEDYGIEIGVANYLGNRKRSFKLVKQKANEYRILPPIGEAAKRGAWMVSYAVHWGDKGADGKMKPYQCIQKMEKLPDGSKRVTRRCPRCEKNSTVSAKRDARAAEFKRGGMTDAVIEEKLKPIDEYLRRYNRGFRFYLNVVNTSSEIGRLDISGTHADQLREQISNLLRNGVDATSVTQGVFFNFFYEGMRGHTVNPVTEAGTTPGSLQLKMLPLTENILRSLKAEAWDLTDLYPSLTENDIQRLVEAEGDSSVVENVFSAGKVTKSEPVAAPGRVAVPTMFGEQKFSDGLDELVGNKPVTVAVAAPVVVKQAVVPAPAIPPPAAGAATMTDEDFEAEFGL